MITPTGGPGGSQQHRVLKGELHTLRTLITDYKLRPSPNVEYLAKLIRLERAITDFMTLASIPPPPPQVTAPEYLYDLIRKQALLIHLARIQYPTINQPLALIEDYCHIRDGHLEAIGTPYPVTMAII